MKQHRIFGLATVAVMAAMLLGGCQKDSITLRITMARYEGGGKVTMDGLVSYWSEGDSLVVNYGAVAIAGSGHSVSISVPTAAMYKAVYPAEYVSDDMTHLAIPQKQAYAVDNQGRQLVKTPMGAYSENSTLQFTPMGSLLAVTVTNSANRGILTVDSIVVKASSAALWGNATVQDFFTDERSCTIDAPYTEGVNDAVMLCGAGGASMGANIEANGSKTFYVGIPAISPEGDNRFTITVHAAPPNNQTPYRYSYTLSQQNACSGNIPNGKLAAVPFGLSANNETEEYRDDIMLYWTSGGDYQEVIDVFIASWIPYHIYSLGSNWYAAVFDSPITQIRFLGFYDCDNLLGISIPNTVTEIASNAFDNCDNLIIVGIPASVTSIGSFAFNECASLAYINIPPNVTTIDDAAFWYCASLSSITIPASIVTIGQSAFSHCTSLANVTCLANTPPNIGPYAFSTINSNAVLHVPSGSVSAYRNSGWNQYFSQILGDAASMPAF